VIAPAEYVDFLRGEYLAGFIRDGGAAVKFAVPLQGVTPDEVHTLFRKAASSENYAYAAVDARDVRVHMAQDIFHAVARQIDWQDRARVFVRAALEEMRFPVPAEPSQLSYEEVARLSGYDVHELRRRLEGKLQQDVLRNYELAQEFRIAMTRLCQAELDRSDQASVDRDNVLAWLRGELRLISALKSALIFQRIARHNARHMLFSLPRWLTKTGKSGLVLDLDISRCAVARRPAEPEGLYYSKAALLDAYELLRQLVDATDELAYCFVLVVVAPEFLDIDGPRSRGLGAYDALRLRVWDEVRDRRRANPHSALVRLSNSGAS